MRRLAVAVPTVVALVIGLLVATSPSALAVQDCTDDGDEWKVCERYQRDGDTVLLYYGIEYRQSGGWGYEHIKAGHGWSPRSDSYVRYTVATGAPADPRTSPSHNPAKTYYQANPNSEPGCVFTVVVNYEKRSWEPAARHIESAWGNGLCGVD